MKGSKTWTDSKYQMYWKIWVLDQSLMKPACPINRSSERYLLLMEVLGNRHLSVVGESCLRERESGDGAPAAAHCRMLPKMPRRGGEKRGSGVCRWRGARRKDSGRGKARPDSSMVEGKMARSWFVESEIGVSSCGLHRLKLGGNVVHTRRGRNNWLGYKIKIGLFG